MCHSWLTSKLKLATCLLLVSASSGALQSDHNQPINIQADTMTLNESEQTSHYKGNVVLTQGSLKILADSLTIHSKQGKIKNIKLKSSKNNRAQFEQRLQDGTLATAVAQQMNFNVSDSTLALFGQAELLQGDSIIRSEHIVYNTETGNLVAGRNNEDERVQILISPQSDTKQQ